MDGEHVENAEAEEHVVEGEYDASGVETRGADGCWNTPEHETRQVRHDRHDVEEIPQIRRVAKKLPSNSWRVIHCDLRSRRSHAANIRIHLQSTNKYFTVLLYYLNSLTNGTCMAHH